MRKLVVLANALLKANRPLDAKNEAVDQYGYSLGEDFEHWIAALALTGVRE